METTAIEAIDPCPKGIVSQLLDIAKANDATSEIGSATGWRWQEGIISRMPKANTVAKVLTKAFGTDDAKVWYKETTGDLKRFIKVTFKGSEHLSVSLGEFIEDKYDTLLYVMANKDLGASYEDLVLNFSYFKFAESYDDNDEHIETPSEETLILTHGSWARKKLEACLKKVPHSILDGVVQIELGCYLANEKFSRHIDELNILRNKCIGYTSIHDMWRTRVFTLTDEENIKFEKELIKFIEEFSSRVKEQSDLSSKLDQSISRKTRLYQFSAISLPSIEGGLR